MGGSKAWDPTRSLMAFDDCLLKTLTLFPINFPALFGNKVVGSLDNSQGDLVRDKNLTSILWVMAARKHTRFSKDTVKSTFNNSEKTLFDF